LEREFREDAKSRAVLHPLLTSMDKDIRTLSGRANRQRDDITRMTNWELKAQETINALVIKVDTLSARVTGLEERDCDKEGRIDQLEEKVYLLESQVRK
jgi:hypothetical protein